MRVTSKTSHKQNEPQAKQITSPKHNSGVGRYSDGIGTTDFYVAGLLGADLAKSDPAFPVRPDYELPKELEYLLKGPAKFNEALLSSLNIPYSFDPKNGDADAACVTLQKLAIAGLKSAPVTSDLTSVAADLRDSSGFAQNPEDHPALRVFRENCISCHSIPSASNYLPFGDSTGLSQRLVADPGLTPKILYRISPGTPLDRRMPLGAPSLSDQQIKAISDYLKALMTDHHATLLPKRSRN